MILLIQPAFAGGNSDEQDAQTINNIYIIKKKNKSWQVPVVIVSFAVGAGVCWFWCGDRPPTESLPEPGPVVRNDVTPDIVYGAYKP